MQNCKVILALWKYAEVCSSPMRNLLVAATQITFSPSEKYIRNKKAKVNTFCTKLQAEGKAMS